MTDTMDIDALIAEGKRAALSAAHDDCLLLSDLAHELEAQQAVVEAARKLWAEADLIADDGEYMNLGLAVDAMVEALAALDAPPPEGDGHET